MKKKSLKKVTSAVLVAAMSMGLLAGCGGSKSSEEAKRMRTGQPSLNLVFMWQTQKTGNGYLQYCSGI